MKKFRKLIPAFVLLLISTAIMSSATFAWFSMNDAVQVTGMQVEAKSNTTYLLISRANTDDVEPTATDIQAENGGAGFTSLALTGSSALYPVAPAITVTDETSHTDYEAGSGASAPAAWYTMIGTDPTASGAVGKANTEKAVGSAALSEYVLKKTFYFTIAKNANNAADLVVDSITITGDPAVRCLVVGTNGSVLYEASTEDDSLVLETSLNDTTVYAVTVYVYYDGNAANIYTNNIPNINDTTVSLTFKVTAGA